MRIIFTLVFTIFFSTSSSIQIDDSSSDLVCNVKGECKGRTLSLVEDVPDLEQCLVLCKADNDCKWLTYFSLSSVCQLMSDCPTLDESCSGCLSGQSECPNDGYVAFIVGGNNETTPGMGYINSVEIYSPEGGCQYQLADIPYEGDYIYWPAVAYLDDKILVCGGNNISRSCWNYDPLANSWSVYSTASQAHTYQPGAVYGKKIYLTDDQNPEVFDPIHNVWSTWPKPLVKTFSYPCLLPWRDSLLLMGGYFNRRGIQIYDVTTQSWSELSTDLSPIPMDIWGSGCAVLPNEDILVLGSGNPDFYRSSAIFNARENSWKFLGNGTYDRDASSLVTLGKRVFAIGGFRGTEVVEEFNYNDETWIPIDVQLLTSRYAHSALPVPARLFSHLSQGCKGVL